MKDEFTLTTGGLAHAVRCDQGTVRKYADAGLLENKRLSDGRRVFAASAVGKLQKLMGRAPQPTSAEA
jgi:DNA-binding transcriptional MerR regulator